MTWIFFLLLWMLPSLASAETVTVDFSVDRGPGKNVGTGFLHGMTGTQPPDSVVLPLKPKMFRCNILAWSDCYGAYPRAMGMGATIQIMPSDAGFYRAPWPGDNGDWSAWIASVTNQVNTALSNGQTNFAWDIWNEPDNQVFWQRSVEQYYETYRIGYCTIKSLDPNAQTVGPSAVQDGSSQFVHDFLLYAKTHNCGLGGNVLPTILSWHTGNEPADIMNAVANARAFMVQNGINISRISINEYYFNQGGGNPVLMLAAFERSGLDSASHSCPDIPSCANLDGIAYSGALYWILQQYAEITGRRVQLTASVNVDGIAGQDSAVNKAFVLLGKSTAPTDTTTLVLTHLESVNYLVNQNTVHVKAELNGPDYWALTTMIDADYPVTNNQATINLTGLGTIDASHNAYSVVLSPGGGGPIPAQSPYPASPSWTGAVVPSSLLNLFAFASPDGSDDWHNTWRADGGWLLNEQDGKGCDANDVYAHTTISRIFGNDPTTFTSCANLNRYNTAPTPTLYQEMMIADSGSTIRGYYYADNLNNFLDHYGMQSTDNGSTWNFSFPLVWGRAADGLAPLSFLHLGMGYALGSPPAPIDNSYLYVYLGAVSPADTIQDVYLARVTPGNFFTRSAYEFVTGIDGSNTPIWGSAANKVVVFTDEGANGGVNVVWDAGISRFLLSTIVGPDRTLGLFEAVRPWGPWKKVYYGPLIDTNRKFAPSIPGKFISADGLTLWVVFSGGPVYDNLNMVKIVLTDLTQQLQTTFQLSWANGSDPESGILSTSIGRCQGIGCTPVPYTTVTYPSTTYTDTAVSPNSDYCYNATHTNGVGLVSTPTPTVCGRLGGTDTTAPAPPTGVIIQ